MLPELQSAFLRALGWSLFDSLWQMGILWILYLGLTANNRKYTATIRHNLALISLFGGFLAFLISFIIHFITGRSSFPVAFADSIVMSGMNQAFGQLMPWISIAYLITSFVLLTKLWREYRLTSRLASESLVKAAPELRIFLRDLSERMGIKREVRIWISGLVDSPLTLGFWKPVVLLPMAVVNNLSLKQTESIILHELYHIRQNDFLINLLISLADIFLFFNPFSKFFRSQIHRERENRCDDMVLQYRYAPGLYAGALLSLEQARAKTAVAATGTGKYMLLARIRRMLTGEQQSTPVSWKLICLSVISLLIACFTLIKPGQLPLKESSSSLAAFMEKAGLNRQKVNPSTGDLAPLTFSSPGLSTENTVAALDLRELPVGDVPEDDDQLEKEIARVIVSEKLENLLLEEAENNTISLVATARNIEFTRSLPSTPKAPVSGTPDLPYVPQNSFEFVPAVADTALRPSKAGPAIASAGLNGTLAAISQIDWDLMEKQLGIQDEQINNQKLELELQKAIMEIDWKMVDKDLAKGLKVQGADMEKYRAQLVQRYQHFLDAKQKRKQAAQAAEAVIAEERLRHAPRPDSGRVRKPAKIVVI